MHMLQGDKKNSWCEDGLTASLGVHGWLERGLVDEQRGAGAGLAQPPRRPRVAREDQLPTRAAAQHESPRIVAVVDPHGSQLLQP